MLKIRVTAGKGLSLPQGGQSLLSVPAQSLIPNTDLPIVPVPAPVQSALASHPSIASALSTSPRIAINPRANRDSLQRKQLWWLPYVVLEFDKNEVLVDALGGDVSGPVWMYSATFDVSRISDIAVTAYLRTTSPATSEAKDGADMGNSDLCLGGVRFTPDLESMVSGREGLRRASN
jgi:serum/glucocorticoid-regulated kinase 2